MSRWVVHSRAAFGARHALTSYLGEPEATHSHRWEVAIRVGTDELNDEGFAVDFLAVHNALQNAVSLLDGSDLNEHHEIGLQSPSAERLAEVLAGWLRGAVEELGARLLSVSVWEGPENRVDLNLEE
jgi:6-pyruvoyltetrahydropterin/6-carboxytetrahydropterin synthase